MRAMLNLDMVGRMRDNRATDPGRGVGRRVVGASSSRVRGGAHRLRGLAASGGYGPSDQMPFYAAGAPVLHFFTGSHADYHKPSDTADESTRRAPRRSPPPSSRSRRRVASGQVVADVQRMRQPARRGRRAQLQRVARDDPGLRRSARRRAGRAARGRARRRAAEKGGLRRGDILIKLGKHAIGSVEDLMYVLNASKPGETVTAVVKRDGKEVKLQVTFEEGRRGK